jgi:hypothetical protein
MKPCATIAGEPVAAKPAEAKINADRRSNVVVMGGVWAKGNLPGDLDGPTAAGDAIPRFRRGGSSANG